MKKSMCLGVLIFITSCQTHRITTEPIRIQEPQSKEEEHCRAINELMGPLGSHKTC